MNDKDPHRPGKDAIYCKTLLGLRDDCNIPYCRQWESSTGWLLYDVGAERWFIEFKCPDHGYSRAWRPEWQPLIEAVVERQVKEGHGQEDLDKAAALQALHDERTREKPSELEF